MTPGKGIVLEHDPQSGGNIPLQITKDHVQAPAIRALVIPILDESVGRILWTAYVVHGTDWKQEARHVGRIHGVSCQAHFSQMFKTPRDYSA